MARKAKVEETYKEFIENIERMDGSDLIGSRFGDFAKYNIQSRALPDARDGLKPVQRRILYGMFVEGNTNEKAYRKSAKSVGAIMGNYHPHGDSSIYGAMARMSQTWNMYIPLVDMHGNNGSIDGDSPAAMRYTEARLEKIVTDYLMQGINKKGVVDMTLNFDETTQEPRVLPVQFPLLLVNGVTGISSGYATDIAPHNLNEVLMVAIELLKNPDMSLKDIMAIMPAPDFPTGGVITSAKDLESVFDSGKGRICLRAKYHIEEINKKTKAIVVTEIPFGVNKSNIVTKIATIIEDKKLVGLQSVMDESDRNGIRIAINFDSNADVSVLLAYLMKNTPLQNDFNANQVVIMDKKPKQVGVRELIKYFNDFRIETKTKELQFDLNKFNERLHIVEGFIKLSDIIDKVVKMIKASDGKQDAKTKLVEQFKFSEAQAESIVVLQLYRISKTDKEQYLDEQKKLEKAIAVIQGLLDSKIKLRNAIIKEYTEIIEKYGVARKSEVVMEEEKWEVNVLDTIAEEEVYVSVSQQGYVKRSTPRSFGSSAKNGMIKDDSELLVEKTTTKSNLLIFTSKGRFLNLPIHTLDDSRWSENGKHISAIAPLKDGEVVVNAFALDLEAEKDKFILVAKNDGKVKRTAVGEHIVVSKFNKLYESVKKIADTSPIEVSGVWLVEDKGYLAFADGSDKKMYFAIDEINPTGLKTDGMKGIALLGDDLINSVEFHELESSIPKSFKYRARGSRGWNK